MALKIRPAHFEDAGRLYDWRVADEDNDWWEGEPVEWARHLQWLLPRLASPVVEIWVAEAGGMPVGQGRLDSNGELAFSVDSGFRGRGYGTELVAKMTEQAQRKGWGRVKANVDLSNTASVKTLEAAGYVLRPDVGFMRWPS